MLLQSHKRIHSLQQSFYFSNDREILNAVIEKLKEMLTMEEFVLFCQQSNYGNIAITLLPFNYKPDEAYRDKFLIQVIFSIVT